MKKSRIRLVSLIVVFVMLLSLLGSGTSIAGEPNTQQGPDTEESGTEGKTEQGEELASEVIRDDLIVQGSACIGFDCQEGEGFGFDTLRLKENNLRIKFEDTSHVAEFPTNDWQLTANDHLNGGLSRFSIDDVDHGTTPFTIEAGAVANALYVDSGSDARIGFGTSNPQVNLHIAEGNTPTVRLDQDGSEGWPKQIWDVAGHEVIFFIRDVTNGNSRPFMIAAGAPTDSLIIDSDGNVGLGPDWSYWVPLAAKFHIENTKGDDVDDFVVTEDGKVGIGTTSPEEMLHLADGGIKFPDGSVQTSAAGAGLWSSSGDDIYRGTGNVGIGTNAPEYPLEVEGTGFEPFFVAEHTDGAMAQVGAGLNVAYFGSKSHHPVEIRVDNEPAIVISPTGYVGIFNENPEYALHVGDNAYCDGTGWKTTSSREVKTDIQSLTSEEAMAAIEELNPIRFHYKTDPNEEVLGFIAEDVPDLVATNDRKGLSSMDIVAVLTKVVQEQQKTISDLSARLTELETKLQESEARNARP
jgi:hypothetical protein